MIDLPEATPAQLAQLKLLVPNVASIINEFQMSTIAANLSFKLTPQMTVLEYLQAMVQARKVTEDNLVDVVRTVRITLLRPSWEAGVDQSIAERGYAYRAVHASEEAPAFAYTVGLTSTAGYELLAHAALPPEILVYVLEVYAALAKQGSNLELERDDILQSNATPDAGLRTKCVPIEPLVATQAHLCHVRGEVKRVYQIIIADKQNRFPNEDGYDRSFHQPCLPRPFH
ncbi:DUF4262 domain-containing protein [Pseudomonas mosselii]|uniref:DUF4262 domain-containing protein n=1 Tax=Pseudomonas mosselii TaxID=78327 RepID=UPI0021DA652D|nr:DUF4262 domain-containing protein [Pseudomonas mosselii]MCU9527480.1 DUF4262 domain-containing protein [Pseudomonas mosselii]MCU9534793.1 DUF4262 domain-containing protein [Pseudomonas mosselii]MCU9542727.1 DUF4262 domain-containing protein [Pseudomonas mosselii]MCU9546633.1 DUF4262 domain-containing protein [Pseudomonas mosselii]